MGRIENPNLKNDYERACGWYGHFNKSEMALFSECTDRYAQKMLDTADIVREAMFRQLHGPPPQNLQALGTSVIISAQSDSVLFYCVAKGLGRDWLLNHF